MSEIISYFKRIQEILLRPQTFFSSVAGIRGWSTPLAFALVTHWLSAGVSYLWRLIISPSNPAETYEFWDQFFQSPMMDQASRHVPWIQYGPSVAYWFFGVSSVLIDPFKTLIAILVSSFWIFLGARLILPAGPQGSLNEVSFESSVKIVSYSMASAILACIPGVGEALAWFYGWILSIIGIKEVYRARTGQALLISLFPKLLFLGILILGLVGVTLLFFPYFSTYR